MTAYRVRIVPLEGELFRCARKALCLCLPFRHFLVLTHSFDVSDSHYVKTSASFSLAHFFYFSSSDAER
jgi:hypothetical protein